MFNLLNNAYQRPSQYGQYPPVMPQSRPSYFGGHHGYQAAPSININIILQSLMGPLMQMLGNYGGQYGNQQQQYGGYGQQQQHHNYGGYGQQQQHYGYQPRPYYPPKPQVIYKSMPYPVHIPVPYEVPCEHPVDYPTTVSANLSGDPTLRVGSMTDYQGDVAIPGLLTSGIDVLPPTGESINLLKDDSNDLSYDAVYHDINGDDASGVAMKQSTITINDKYQVEVLAQDDGELLVTVLEGGDAVHWQGKLSDGEDSFDIDGLQVSFAQRPDGVDDDGNVVNALRAVVNTGEYEFTWGARDVHDDTLPYLDANFAEVDAHAADDATSGFTVDVDLDGTTETIGLADILNLGDGDNENSALYQQFLDASA